MSRKLFHVSENAGIEEFIPRIHATWPDLGPHVWAIEEQTLVNYLLPRECPRVTFYAGPTTTVRDIDRYLLGDPSMHKVVIENVWLSRVSAARVHMYQMPQETFREFDKGAGYWISSEACRPCEAISLTGLTKEIERRGASFETSASLWPLFDKVVASSLQFSMIRMRNANPRGDLDE